MESIYEVYDNSRIDSLEEDREFTEAIKLLKHNVSHKRYEANMLLAGDMFRIISLLLKCYEKDPSSGQHHLNEAKFWFKRVQFLRISIVEYDYFVSTALQYFRFNGEMDEWKNLIIQQIVSHTNKLEVHLDYLTYLAKTTTNTASHNNKLVYEHFFVFRDVFVNEAKWWFYYLNWFSSTISIDLLKRKFYYLCCLDHLARIECTPYCTHNRLRRHLTTFRDYIPTVINSEEYCVIFQARLDLYYLHLEQMVIPDTNTLHILSNIDKIKSFISNNHWKQIDRQLQSDLFFIAQKTIRQLYQIHYREDAHSYIQGNCYFQHYIKQIVSNQSNPSYIPFNELVQYLDTSSLSDYSSIDLHDNFELFWNKLTNIVSVVCEDYETAANSLYISQDSILDYILDLGIICLLISTTIRQNIFADDYLTEVPIDWVWAQFWYTKIVSHSSSVSLWSIDNNVTVTNKVELYHRNCFNTYVSKIRNAEITSGGMKTFNVMKSFYPDMQHWLSQQGKVPLSSSMSVRDKVLFAYFSSMKKTFNWVKDRENVSHYEFFTNLFESYFQRDYLRAKRILERSNVTSSFCTVIKQRVETEIYALQVDSRYSENVETVYLTLGRMIDSISRRMKSIKDVNVLRELSELQATIIPVRQRCYEERLVYMRIQQVIETTTSTKNQEREVSTVNILQSIVRTVVAVSNKQSKHVVIDLSKIQSVVRTEVAIVRMHELKKAEKDRIIPVIQTRIRNVFSSETTKSRVLSVRFVQSAIRRTDTERTISSSKIAYLQAAIRATLVKPHTISIVQLDVRRKLCYNDLLFRRFLLNRIQSAIRRSQKLKPNPAVIALQSAIRGSIDRVRLELTIKSEVIYQEIEYRLVRNVFQYWKYRCESQLETKSEIAEKLISKYESIVLIRKRLVEIHSLMKIQSFIRTVERKIDFRAIPSKAIQSVVRGVVEKMEQHIYLDKVSKTIQLQSIIRGINRPICDRTLNCVTALQSVFRTHNDVHERKLVFKSDFFSRVLLFRQVKKLFTIWKSQYRVNESRKMLMAHKVSLITLSIQDIDHRTKMESSLARIQAILRQHSTRAQTYSVQKIQSQLRNTTSRSEVIEQKLRVKTLNECWRSRSIEVDCLTSLQNIFKLQSLVRGASCKYKKTLSKQSVSLVQSSICTKRIMTFKSSREVTNIQTMIQCTILKKDLIQWISNLNLIHSVIRTQGICSNRRPEVVRAESVIRTGLITSTRERSTGLATSTQAIFRQKLTIAIPVDKITRIQAMAAQFQSRLQMQYLIDTFQKRQQYIFTIRVSFVALKAYTFRRQNLNACRSIVQDIQSERLKRASFAKWVKAFRLRKLLDITRILFYASMIATMRNAFRGLQIYGEVKNREVENMQRMQIERRIRLMRDTMETWMRKWHTNQLMKLRNVTKLQACIKAVHTQVRVKVVSRYVKEKETKERARLLFKCFTAFTIWMQYREQKRIERDRERTLTARFRDRQAIKLKKEHMKRWKKRMIGGKYYTARKALIEQHLVTSFKERKNSQLKTQILERWVWAVYLKYNLDSLKCIIAQWKKRTGKSTITTIDAPKYKLRGTVCHMSVVFGEKPYHIAFKLTNMKTKVFRLESLKTIAVRKHQKQYESPRVPTRTNQSVAESPSTPRSGTNKLQRTPSSTTLLSPNTIGHVISNDGEPSTIAVIDFPRDPHTFYEVTLTFLVRKEQERNKLKRVCDYEIVLQRCRGSFSLASVTMLCVNYLNSKRNRNGYF